MPHEITVGTGGLVSHEITVGTGGLVLHKRLL